MKISVCGIYCDKECRAYGKECKGCNQLKGRVSWAKYLGKDVCPIYQCVIDKGLDNCGQCEKMPCKMWLVDTKNPDMSDEEYAKDLERRMKNLNGGYNEAMSTL